MSRIVKLISILGDIIINMIVDMLYGTPHIYIKPFYLRFDNMNNVKIGWYEKNKNMPIEKLFSDERFWQLNLEFNN